MVGGKYYGSVTCNTTPSISPAEALETSYKITGMRPADVRESDVKLVIAPKAGEFFLAYRVWLNQWELVLNAMDGKVIDQFERILRIDGTGNVYPKDPVNSSLTTVTIPRLLGAGTTLAYALFEIIGALFRDVSSRLQPEIPFRSSIRGCRNVCKTRRWRYWFKWESLGRSNLIFRFLVCPLL